jgi:tetratricopeptide (TPR) repeat protein
MRELFPSCDYDERVEQLIERDKKYKKTYRILKKAHTALERGTYKKALEHYRELVNLVPDNPSWLEQLGNLYSVETSYPQAMECFESALKLTRKDKRSALLEKMFYLAYVYNDFERADECAAEISVGASQEVEFEILRLRINRHLLAEKAYPLDHFENMMVECQKQATGSNNPVVHITHGFSYLYLGSHLLDSDLWSSKAREVFIEIIKRKGFRSYHPYAYEGLYLVYLMDNRGDELMDLLREWVRIDGREKIRNLYLDELIRRQEWREGQEAIKEFFQDNRESLLLRQYSQRFSHASWTENGLNPEERTRHLKALQQICAENPQDYLAYFDLGLGLFYFMDEEPDESSYYRITQAMKKAQKLRGEDPELEAMMLKVVDFAGRINRQEERLAYSKKRIFLEKALAKFPEDENLIFEFGKLCLKHEQDQDLGCKYLFKAVTMSPELVETNMYLGHYFFERQDLRRAYHYYLKVIERPVTMKVWGEILEQMQRIL